MALMSDFVTAEVVDAMEFPELAERHHVRGVPRTVVNGTVHIEGAVPESVLMDELAPLIEANTTAQRTQKFRKGGVIVFRKHRLINGVLAVAIGLAIAAPAMAQRQNRPGQGRIYDPRTEATVTGTVTDVKTLPSRGGGRGLGGTHVLLKTETETVDVRLGPTAFMKEQQFAISPGDTLQVTGSRVTIDGAKALIAREVRRGDATLTLRDATGRPKWAGGPRR
jgi:hypothetical protein